MAFELMNDAASRLTGKVQLTTDGLYWYPHAVERAFGIDVDYAVQTKNYADAQWRIVTSPFAAVAVAPTISN